MKLRLLSPKAHIIDCYVIFQPIGTISILLRFDGPQDINLLKISLASFFLKHAFFA